MSNYEQPLGPEPGDEDIIIPIPEVADETWLEFINNNYANRGLRTSLKAPFFYRKTEIGSSRTTFDKDGSFDGDIIQIDGRLMSASFIAQPTDRDTGMSSQIACLGLADAYDVDMSQPITQHPHEVIYVPIVPEEGSLYIYTPDQYTQTDIEPQPTGRLEISYSGQTDPTKLAGVILGLFDYQRRFVKHEVNGAALLLPRTVIEQAGYKNASDIEDLDMDLMSQHAIYPDRN